MKLSEFDYHLPKELIAQYPSPKRGEDRLLVVNKAKSSFEEKQFCRIVDYFKKGDILVLNNTKVLPARLFGKRRTGGKVEIFIVDKTKRPVEALIRPGGRIKDGEEVLLGDGHRAKVLGKAGVGRFVEFDGPIDEIMAKCGHVPLPPYISREDESSDRERYQTVYAACVGATASPTAGLHFTGALIEELKGRDVHVAQITLHVSYGTFAPVKEETVEDHSMHSEFYHISKEDALVINEARNRKAKFFACGTTSLRTIETCADAFVNFIAGAHKHIGEEFRGFEGFTNLFIYPGYRFRMTDSLITNFHLPKSTLLLLTSAFAGKELLFEAYKYAIEKRFRFFSYGDAMLII
ncbi:MAG: tRNA preQ1(34) S-adenosylmethionine ribosyltransferase-isomerase QueA [Candidatus Omnitrophota bacterium]